MTQKNWMKIKCPPTRELPLVISAPSPPPPLPLFPSPAMPKASEEEISAQDAFAIGAVIGGVVGGCLLMALAAGAYVWIKRCKQRPPSQPTSSAKATGEVTLTEATTERRWI